MAVRTITISAQTIQQSLREGNHCHYTITKGLPPDATVVGARLEWDGHEIQLLVQSELWQDGVAHRDFTPEMVRYTLPECPECRRVEEERVDMLSVKV